MLPQKVSEIFAYSAHSKKMNLGRRTNPDLSLSSMLFLAKKKYKSHAEYIWKVVTWLTIIKIFAQNIFIKMSQETLCFQITAIGIAAACLVD